MPLTYTGRRVKPGGTDHPGIVDIAVGMSRAARFAGQTARWFSVLDHSLFCDEMVKAADDHGLVSWPDKFSPTVVRTDHLRLAVLLHDAHEAMTGDVPTDWKGKDLRGSQLSLDHMIMGAYFPGGIAHYMKHHEAVKSFDRRALVAEAQVIGPPVKKEVILEAFGMTDDTPDDITLLRNLIELWDNTTHKRTWFAQPPFHTKQDEHPGVQEYIKRVISLL